MNRREAIQKLAAGGAIAAGGSLVLSSNNVAFAASGCMLVDVPADGAPLPLAAGDAGTGVLDIAVSPPPSCTCDDFTPMYDWTLTRFSITPPNGSMTASQTSTSTVRLTKLDKKGRPKAFHGNDQFAFLLKTSWQCGTECITASYNVAGVYSSLPPIATNASYTTC
jgi:hypothetical protein